MMLVYVMLKTESEYEILIFDFTTRTGDLKNLEDTHLFSLLYV